MNPSVEGTAKQGSAVWWAIALAFFGLLAWVVVPGIHIGFASDDFVHLVEDSNLPWYASSDHLNRPLRNALFRALPRIFGLNPIPYRLVAFVFYVLTAVLLFRLSRKLGLGQAPSLAITVLFAFFPRNYETLFWFAAFQDLIVSSCVLFACLTWLKYLRSGELRWFVATYATYVLALGFKETSVGLPAVLLGLELYTTNVERWKDDWWKISRKYLLAVPIVATLAAYIFLFGSHSAAAAQSKSVYGGTSVFGMILPLTRTFVNLILQFSPAVILRDMTKTQLIVSALGCVAIAVAIWFARNGKLALLGLLWFLIFALPTAAFARAVNADRYLMLPYIGLLFVIGGAVQRMDTRQGWRVALLAVVLVAYALAGGRRLMHFREAYRDSSIEVNRVREEAAGLLNLPALTAANQVVLANLDQSGEVYILNNGVRGLLMTKGLSGKVPVIYNFGRPLSTQAQRVMVESLQACTPGPSSASARQVLLFSGSDLSNVGGTCADRVVETDRSQRPDAWFEDPERAGGAGAKAPGD